MSVFSSTPLILGPDTYHTNRPTPSPKGNIIHQGGGSSSHLLSSFIPQELPSILLKHTHVASVDMLPKQSLFEPTALGLCMMSGACVHMSM